MNFIKKFKLRNLIFFLFLLLYSTNLYAELTRDFNTVIRPGTTGFINADGFKSTNDSLQDPVGFYISPDGKTAFNANNMTSGNHRCITQLKLETPFELSSATLVDESNILNTVALRSGGRDDCHDVYVSPDGKHMSVSNEQGAIYDFNLPNPFSLRNATIKAGYLNPFVNAPIRGDDIWFSHDGSKMFVIDVDGDNLKEYTTVSPFTSNGVTLINTVDLTSEAAIDGTEAAVDFFFDDTGRTLMILVNDTGTGEHDDTIFHFSLRVPFDTTTLTLAGSSVIGAYDGTENNGDAVAISFGKGGTRLYIMNKDGGPLLGTRTDTLSQFNLPCSYGIVQCLSDTSSSIETQFELVKQNIGLNVNTIFKRFEWIKRNRDDENLSAHNFKINYEDPLLKTLANKFEPSVRNNVASFISKHKTEDKKSKWSSWSLADISLSIFGVDGNGSVKAKDLNTRGLTLGTDRKFGDNKFFGLALRYSDGSSDIKFSEQDVTMESLTLNLYGISPSMNNQYINAVLGLSHLRFDHRYNGNLSGERTGKQAFATINYRTKKKHNFLNLTPTGKLTYGVTELSEFTDFLGKATGLPSQDIRYKEDTFVNGEFAGGFLFETDIIETDKGTIQPMGGLEILYDLTNGVNYKHMNQGGTHVNKDTIHKHAKETLKYSFGFEAIHLNGFTVSADYQRINRLNNKTKRLPKIKTETFILKFSHSKEEDNQFALIYDPINAHQTNLSYSKNIHGLDFKINSNQSLENSSEYYTNLEVSGKF